MKLLLLALQELKNFNQHLRKDAVYVFSLNDKIDKNSILEYYHPKVLQNEKKFADLLFSLFPKIRELFIDFVAEWGNIPIKSSGENFKELFQWDGMALWWVSNLVRKDSEVDNHYFYRLCYLFFIQQLLTENNFQIYLLTDDRDFAVAAKANFNDIDVTLIKESKPKLLKKRVKILFNAIGFMFFDFLSLEIFKRIIGKGNTQSILYREKVFFTTVFPSNWKRENGIIVDRMYSKATLSDHFYGKKTIYLMNSFTPRKQFINFFKFKKQLMELVQQTKRPVIFLDSYIRHRDLLLIYFCILKYRLLFFKLKKTSFFFDSFQIGGLNVSAILVPELVGSIESFYQSQKYGISFQRFFENFKSQQTVVTYGESLVLAKSAYYCIKKANPDNQIITIQHAINCRNKIYLYHRRSEFASDGKWDGIQLSPMADFYLVQGDQYKKILKEWYPEERIKIIGCLKYGNYPELIAKKQEIQKKCYSYLKDFAEKEKIALLAPSINDIDSIFFILSKANLPRNYRFILSPHPTTPIVELKKTQSKLAPELKIEYIEELRTNELLTISDIVICGYSSIAIEAAIYGILAIRLNSSKIFPLFDNDDIPYFRDPEAFTEWINNYHISGKNKVFFNDLSKLVESYFFKIDSKADMRLWQTITSIQQGGCVDTGRII